jgi:hypothetical protein
LNIPLLVIQIQIKIPSLFKNTKHDEHDVSSRNRSAASDQQFMKQWVNEPSAIEVWKEITKGGENKRVPKTTCCRVS